MPTPQEIITFDEPTSHELLRMLQDFHRQPTRLGFAPEDGSPPASGVYICKIPEDGEDLAAFTGSGEPPSMDLEVFLLEAGALPAAEMSLAAVTNPDDSPSTEKVYNVLDSSFAAGSYVLAINPRHGYLVVIGGGGGEHCVILNAALPAATNSKTGATSGLATICKWSRTTEAYEETSKQIKVWNHSEATGHAVDTFGTARFIDEHYWFFGDCDAMAMRGGA